MYFFKVSSFTYEKGKGILLFNAPPHVDEASPNEPKKKSQKMAN
jgi:hypothetical protein